MKTLALLSLLLAIITFVGIFWPVDNTKSTAGIYMLAGAVGLLVLSVCFGVAGYQN